ncbi:hypothetical protein LEMLEM_LOCUS4069 [Lemmus lemmus]
MVQDGPLLQQPEVAPFNMPVRRCSLISAGFPVQCRGKLEPSGKNQWDSPFAFQEEARFHPGERKQQLVKSSDNCGELTPKEDEE